MTVSAGVAAVMWGASDFIAGVLARRLRVTTVLICSKVFGMALSLPVVAAGGMPSSHDSHMAMAAGFIGLPALGLLYRAMRDGSLIIVAPVAAAAALVPVGWGLLGGERFGAAGVLGVAVALIGVTLASWPVAGGRPRPARLSTMVSALGAALGFGTYFVLLHQASGTDAYGVIAVSHLCGGAGALVLAAALALRKRRRRHPAAILAPAFATPGKRRLVAALPPALVTPGKRRLIAALPPALVTPGKRRLTAALPAVLAAPGKRRLTALAPVLAMCGVGALDVAGDAAFIFAAHGGPLGQAAVLASLYPAVTVVLNRSVLRERMHAVHLCGVLAALFAVACLAS